MKEVLVTVPLDRSKTTKVEVNGVKGGSCHDITASLQQALGETVSDQPTEEMYEQPVEVNHHIRQSQR